MNDITKTPGEGTGVGSFLAASGTAPPAPPTFREWLATRIKRDSPIGDLARDAARDPRLPRDWQTAAQLRDQLACWGACEGARRAMDRAERAFLKAVRP